MSTAISKNSVKAVRAYLKEINVPITQVQGYEVVARAWGFKNKHVLASTTTLPVVTSKSTTVDATTKYLADNPVRILKRGEKYLSISELEALDWHVDIVVPVSFSDMADIDILNDKVSELITGSETGLQEIGYTVYPYFYDEQTIALRVVGFVEDADYLPEESENSDGSSGIEDPLNRVHNENNAGIVNSRYLPAMEIKKLARLIERSGCVFDLSINGKSRLKRIVYVSDSGIGTLSRFHDFLKSGDHEDLNDLVFEYIDSATQGLEADGESFSVNELASAKKIAEQRYGWTDNKGNIFELSFQ